MKAEDPIQDFAPAWRELDVDGAAVIAIPHPFDQTFDLHGYFRLVERLRRGEATLEELLASQELYDNHFLKSPVWRTARESAHHHK